MFLAWKYAQVSQPYCPATWEAWYRAALQEIGQLTPALAMAADTFSNEQATVAALMASTHSLLEHPDEEALMAFSRASWQESTGGRVQSSAFRRAYSSGPHRFMTMSAALLYAFVPQPVYKTDAVRRRLSLAAWQEVGHVVPIVEASTSAALSPQIPVAFPSAS